MSKYKKHLGKGWHYENVEHGMCARGIKLGRHKDALRKIDYARQISEIKKRTTYSDGEFEYKFSPIEDTINVTKVADGYVVKYLVNDNDPESPDAWGDDSLFLVHYHNDFYVENKNIITKEDASDLYNGQKIEQEKDYWILPVSALIHSGVWLKLGHSGFAEDSGGWDTSHVGLVLASKKEFKSKKQAEKAMESLVESWNQYLSGDVYCVVAEKYDNDKNPVDYDVVHGFYGLEYAKNELKDFKYDEKVKAGQKKLTDFAKNTLYRQRLRQKILKVKPVPYELPMELMPVSVIDKEVERRMKYRR